MASIVVACSKQSEGDRCEVLNGDADCESGLVCTSARDLNATDEVDRCCPPSESPFSDSRCDRSGPGPVTGTGGATSTGGQGSIGGAAGSGGLPSSPGAGGANAGSAGALAGSAGTSAGSANPG